MALVADDHPASDIVALNAGAAIYTAGCAHSFEDGVEAAWEVIESGEAMQKFEALARLTQNERRITHSCSTTILDRIIARKRQEVADRQSKRSIKSSKAC